MCRSVNSWIGLYKNTQSSTDPSPSAQHWLDGSTSTFRRWNSGEPNGNTHCIRIRKTSGVFEDRGCGSENSFVCKRTGGECCFITDAHIAVRDLTAVNDVTLRRVCKLFVIMITTVTDEPAF